MATATERQKTVGKPRGRPFQPGNTANLRGRPKGTRNKVTLEARAAAAQIVDDPEYRRKLLLDARARKLAPAVEQMLWHYAKGVPKQVVKVEGDEDNPLVGRIEHVIIDAARHADTSD